VVPVLRRPLRTRATILSFVACSALVLAVTAPASGQEDPRTKQGQVQGQQAVVAGQIDVLEASAADVEASLASMQAGVAAAEAALAAAQAQSDAANAALAAATAQQAAAQAEVDQRLTRLRQVAIDAYVSSDARMLEEEVTANPSPNADAQLLRASLASIRADQEDVALARLHTAQAARADATNAASTAAATADAQRAAAQAQADAVRSTRDEQSRLTAQVEQRLDDKLSEAAALRSIDKQLATQIAAEELAVAKQVAAPSGGGATSTTPTTKPPPPPGFDDNPPPPPPPAHPDLATTRGITVARSIADNLAAMIDGAAAAGVVLTGSGYRDYASQVALRKQNCGTATYDIYYRPASECSPPTARPGQSRHELGLAVDFAAGGHAIVAHDDPAWVWLSVNAKTYGFYNLPAEPWHWSVDGT
jgi:hypothetical protein